MASKRPSFFVAGIFFAFLITAGLIMADRYTPASAEEATQTEAAQESAGDENNGILRANILGDDDAPLKITEYASLTCSHCATFHTGTFKEFKENYVDTGKVRFEFVDFPLNAPALQGSMIAHCLPQKRYFAFIGFLFENQESWLSSGDLTGFLKQNAKLLGMSEAEFDACLANEDLQNAIIARLQKHAEEHDINSTPSFVIEGQDEPIRGALSFEGFSKRIDAALSDKGQSSE